MEDRDEEVQPVQSPPLPRPVDSATLISHMHAEPRMNRQSPRIDSLRLTRQAEDRPQSAGVETTRAEASMHPARLDVRISGLRVAEIEGGEKGRRRKCGEVLARFQKPSSTGL